MASRNYKEYLKRDIVKTKKYFYVLRPLLACLWIELKQTAPPMEFEILLNELVTDEKVKSEIKILLERKRGGYEFAEEKKIECINEYIESSIEHFENAVSEFNPANKPSAEKMDLAFLEILRL